MKWIYALWWMGNNFGDVLTPFIIEKLSGKRAVYAWPDPSRTVYTVTGSIMTVKDVNKKESGCVVWGNGVIDATSWIPKPTAVHAVRGKITKSRMESYGLKCPDVFGDPALVLPLLYRPSVRKKHPLGIVPHWEDMASAYQKYGNVAEAMMINVTDPVERVIDDICSCEKIVSSSLHGLIVADAYSIPNRWAQFRNKGDWFKVKFMDYWSGIDAPVQECLDLTGAVLSYSQLASSITAGPNKYSMDALLDACPFL